MGNNFNFKLLFMENKTFGKKNFSGAICLQYSEKNYVAS